MIKRVLVLAAILTLLLTAPAGASVREPAAAPPVQTDTAGACSTTVHNVNWDHHTNTSPNVSRSGVAADIRINAGGFDMCTSGVGTNPDGPAAFIALRPRSILGIDAGLTSPETDILAIGIVECRDGANQSLAICTGDESPRFFWAAGGCNGNTGWPFTWMDLGAADTTLHHYEIYYTGSGTIKGTIDGSQEFLIDEDSYSKTGCWTDGSVNLGAEWAAYKYDSGDSLGSSGGPELKFTDARYGTAGSGWSSPGFITGSCQNTFYADSVCTVSGSDNMTVYSN